MKILKKMNSTSIIIPIHEFNDNISTYLNKAIESIINQQEVEKPDVLIVYSSTIENEINNFIKEKYFNYNFKLIKNNGNTDYQSQVNLAVDSVNTDYFTVLEFDDELGLTYLKNINEYVKAYPNIDIFLIMMIEVTNENKGIKLTNEMVWSQQFVGENGELGYLNLNSIKQYTDFKLSGAAIKKSEFINLGRYKRNIKLTFMYEFILRALNNASKIFAIPKIGYRHLINREGSLFDGYLKNMPMDERKFWFETAFKESNFTTDREIDISKLKEK